MIYNIHGPIAFCFMPFCLKFVVVKMSLILEKLVIEYCLKKRTVLSFF